MVADAAAVECEDLVVSYGDAVVVDIAHLRVTRGASVALLGPSGSGKTTVLHAVAGFVTPQRGRIRIDGRTVVGDGARTVPPEHRRVGVVFQHYALWPHLDALDTVAYPLRRRGVAAADARAHAADLLTQVGVGTLGQRRPAELSGGQQQRVGLARALASEASLYLFDEPTAHLDTPLRAAVQRTVAELRRRSGAALITATHDAAEALALSDAVVLLRDGAVVQTGPPEQVYERPVDAWAARMTGPASLVRAEWTGDGRVAFAGRLVPVDSVADRVPTRGAVTLLLRPDWVLLGGPLDGRVVDRRYGGTHTDVVLDTVAGEVLVRQPGRSAVAIGDHVRWGVRAARVLPPSDADDTVGT